MPIADYQFELPDELIAQSPAQPRDSARLLVYDRADKTINDAVFRDLPKFLHPQTTLVRNQAKVDKARLMFGKLEIFILEAFNDKTVKAMVRPGKKFKLDAKVELLPSLSVRVIAVDDEGFRNLEFSKPLDDPVFKPHQMTPLPPYIAQDESLADEYQTVYARDPGSKAAPTAGLHFTEELLKTIEDRWPVVDVTLDVGLGTFAPISDDDVHAKRLHHETYSISAKAAQALNLAEHITAVGTTSARLLESAYTGAFEQIKDASTDIFIQPGDELRAVNSIITNTYY